MQNVNALPAPTIELKDIHIPEQISSLPIAYGWWILAALFIVLIIISIINIRKRIKRNEIKKQALKKLKNSPEQSIDNTIALLKWAAMHYFSRIEIAKLFGNSLQQFLISTLPIKHQENFTKLSNKAFSMQYKTPIYDAKDTHISEQFSEAAKVWLTHALPPKPHNVSKSKTINIHTTTSENTVQGANS